ncbi:hypothetical protein [Nocardia sp. NPDC006630]|uniref:hypothetical protein n=1 Tax=Nocardia sp. NPDC006630 TaxID=3157181 RepID=UPI0033B98E95
MAFVVRVAAAVATMGISTLFAVPVSFAHPAPVPLPPSHAKPAATATVSSVALAERMLAAIQEVSPGAEAGIEVMDTQNGMMLAATNQDQQFYTASVVKLLIALDVLDDPAAQSDSSTTDAVRRMLSASDDGIADQLWESHGGAAIVTRMADRIGMSGTTPPSDSGQWGETLTTARDVVSAYRYLTSGAPAPVRDLVLDALGQASQTAADGVDQYFGIPSALSDSPWAVKQGWMWMSSSLILNTTGLVGSDLRYAVVVLSSQPTMSLQTAGSALTAGVQVLRDTLPPQAR